MLFASLIREGCRVKLRFPPEEGKRFFVQFSKDILDSKGPADEELEVSELEKMEAKEDRK